jgi:linoleoyl-CoA desaturase
MSATEPIRFGEKITSSGFARTLNQRVDAYFQERGISRHANAAMIAKTVLGFALWVATYLLLISDRFSAAGVVTLFVVHGFAQLYMAFNIAHDANHGGYSSSRRVNRLFSCVFDLVGVSSYVWRLLHNDSHHSFVNIDGSDTALTSGSVLRFSPHEKRRRHHRYQHLYGPLLYCLSTLDWVLIKDFRWLFYKGGFGNRRIARHPRGEILFMLLTKAFYYTYVLVLPLVLLSVPWYVVLLGFVVMHAFIGFTIALIFQPTHITEGTTYPRPGEDGQVGNNFVDHVFETTSDFARGNPFANWLLGCLNLHVVHHMFPRICHVHYPALSQILKETAEEFGLVYRERRTVTEAFVAHLRWLKALGAMDDPLAAKAA